MHACPLGSNSLRVLASPAYLKNHGMPKSVEALSGHSLLGFTQPESLNQWPLRHALGDTCNITPSLSASSGETLRQLALSGAGIVCLADFMTAADSARGDLVQLLARRCGSRFMRCITATLPWPRASPAFLTTHPGDGAGQLIQALGVQPGHIDPA